MIRGLCLALVLAIPGAAAAQPMPPITATPLLPPSAQIRPPDVAPPPPDRSRPVPAPAEVPKPVAFTWVPQGTALLQVLDKVNAQNAVLTVKVGQQATFGSLSIEVAACSVHPPDQPPDSAAYVAITDSHADAPGFRGWLLANNPSVSMLQHPIYDVRVVGCRT